MNKREAIIAVKKLLEDYLNNPSNLESIDVIQHDRETIQVQITDVYLLDCLQSVFGLTSLNIKAKYKEVIIDSIEDVSTKLNPAISQLINEVKS